MAVPAAIPFTTPDVDPIVAMVTSELDQVPPVVVLVSVEELPMHAESVPPIIAGRATTVTVAVRLQPVDKV